MGGELAVRRRAVRSGCVLAAREEPGECSSAARSACCGDGGQPGAAAVVSVFY